jgi:ABC-type branched-subunit amino acid transport system substrate-binding protein
MVPSDVQRAPLMIQQINALESQLKLERARDTIRLGIVYRNDPLGQGTSSALSELMLNGKSLAANVDANAVKINPYDPTDTEQTDQKATIAAYLTFKPDIIVLAGTAEAITTVLRPLEAAWPAGEPRPQYVLIDSVKVPDLLTDAKVDDLRQRVRGTGITPNPTSQKVYDAFKLAYTGTFPDGNPAISGMGPAYDATLAVAFSIARAREREITGSVLAEGLRSLAGGPTEILMGSQQILPAFKKLTAGENITSIGTFAPLEWDSDGAVLGGTIEMWCIGAGAGTPAYKSSGLTYELKTGIASGTFTPCQ